MSSVGRASASRLSARRSPRYLNGGAWTLLAEFNETESGKSHENRPKLAEAMALCRRTGATLVIARLDRLSRNVAFLAALVESKVPFVACDNPHATKFTIHILAAVAEHEREMIARARRRPLKPQRPVGSLWAVGAGVPRWTWRKAPRLLWRAPMRSPQTSARSPRTFGVRG